VCPNPEIEEWCWNPTAAGKVVEARALDDARYLSNFSLHSSALPHPLATTVVRSGGQLHLRIPDLPRPAVDFIWDLAFEEDRDLETYASQLIVAVEQFIDDLCQRLKTRNRIGLGSSQHRRPVLGATFRNPLSPIPVRV